MKLILTTMRFEVTGANHREVEYAVQKTMTRFYGDVDCPVPDSIETEVRPHVTTSKGDITAWVADVVATWRGAQKR